MQIASAVVLSSWVVFGLFLLFLVVNMFYFPLFEEKALIKRFGEKYILYKNNVPRWLPRLTPWTLPKY
jgi:protein-S-isoprenylcysteine O-methyltransferase Ste14